MPRSKRLRNLIKECDDSTRNEKLSYIPPYLILIIEIILLVHAFYEKQLYVMILTSSLLIISFIEIVLVSGEMHKSYKQSNFDRVLTIRLDDFIIERKEENVKKIIADFLKQHPEYTKHRNEIYHTACQILETHRQEEIEKDLDNKLKNFIKDKPDANVDDIIEDFVKKYPKYKIYRSEVYERTCKIKSKE